MVTVRRCLAVALVLSGCGTTATAPPQVSDTTRRLHIAGNDVVTLLPGEAEALSVSVVNGAGDVISPAEGTPVWTTSDSSVAQVSRAGVVRAGDSLGAARIAVRDSAGLSDSVTVWVQPPETQPSLFHITLLYADGVPRRWRDALASAAARWEEIVRGELPEVTLNSPGGDCPTPPGEPPSPPLTGTERGVRIYVGFSGSYPDGTFVEATGGPCLQRPLPRPTTILGIIVLNRDKPVDSIPGDRLRYLAVHEMGHALGLVALVQGAQPPWYDPPTGVYTGTLAIEGYRQEYGWTPDDLLVNAGSHWAFGPDVMSGSGGSSGIHAFTVGALMDAGYPAAWYGAGPY